MNEKFFLKYANSNLRENPELLRWFVSDIIIRDERIGEVKYVQEDVDEYQDIARAIISLVNEEKVPLPDDSDSSQGFSIESVITVGQEIPYENRKELVTTVMERYKDFFGGTGFKQDLSQMLGIYDLAYSSIYGHDFGMCLTELLNDRVKLFGSELFQGPRKLKCYECDQLHFVNILNEIIEGKEYNQINWLETFIQMSNDVIKFRREIELHKLRSNGSKKNTSSVILKERKLVEIPLNFKKNFNTHISDFGTIGNFVADINSFRMSLICAAIYSLTEYLLQNDRRVLKQCQLCSTFFEAGKIDKRIKYCPICSPKSKMTREERRQYQRDYRRKLAKNKFEQKRGNEILKWIGIGWTKEEAEQLWEDDQRM